MRQRVGKERILTSRYAYRDKNAGIPGAACKPKARLCVGGHNDPDLQSGMRTDAPTVGRHAVQSFFAVAAAYGFDVVAGDVECAFMQGKEHERTDELYMAQPREGIPGLHPEQIIRIVKGVFGLADAPRLWWRQLRNGLLGADLKTKTGETVQLQQSRCSAAT